MKKLWILALSAFLFTIQTTNTLVHAQGVLGNHYVTKVPITVYEVNTDTFTLKNSTKANIKNKHFAGHDRRFVVVDICDDNNFLIKFYSTSYMDTLSKDGAKGKNLTRIVNSPFNYTGVHSRIDATANDKFFVLKSKDFQEKCDLFYPRRISFVYGAMTVPIKLRMGDFGVRRFDFEEKLNLGFSVGARRQFRSRIPQSINFLFNGGIAAVRIDENNVWNPSLNISSARSTAAFTMSFGIIYQIDIFQTGIYVGSDLVPSNLGIEWFHQGRPWIGVGLGISFFSKHENTKSNKEAEQKKGYQ